MQSVAGGRQRENRRGTKRRWNRLIKFMYLFICLFINLYGYL